MLLITHSRSGLHQFTKVYETKLSECHLNIIQASSPRKTETKVLRNAEGSGVEINFLAVLNKMSESVLFMSDILLFNQDSVSKKVIRLFKSNFLCQCLEKLLCISKHWCQNYNIACSTFLHVKQLLISKTNLSGLIFSKLEISAFVPLSLNVSCQKLVDEPCSLVLGNFLRIEIKLLFYFSLQFQPSLSL